MSLRLTLPVLAFGLVSCGAEKPAPAAVPDQTAPPAAAPVAAPAPAAATMVRGIVRLQPSPSFRSCEATSQLTLIDNTGGRLAPNYRFMQANDTDGLYVLASGTINERGEMVLGEIEFAGLPATTGGCEGPAPDYSMAVRGGEPAWSLTVTGSGIEFSRGGDQPAITFPAVTPDDSGGMTRYQAATTGAEHSLHLLLSRTGCTGSRAAAMYASMQARAVIDGQSLSGCAWRGRLP